MHDPREGRTPTGGIRTGVSAARVDDVFRPVLEAAVDGVLAAADAAAVHVYGSVATGCATAPASDVDLLTIGLAAEPAAALAADLSHRFADRCRAVEIGVALAADLDGDDDEAYGLRVFLHHYCARLAGPDLDRATADFAADSRAARGFNGDIGRRADRWRAQMGEVAPRVLARRIGRKTLLAVAGLVSVHDATWTTDRRRAAARWSEVDPAVAVELALLLEWATSSTADGPVVDRAAVEAMLAGGVAAVVESFAADIGLWA